MKSILLLSCLLAFPYFEMSNASNSIVLLHDLQTSKDSSLLKPSDAAYTEAMEFVRFLKVQGLSVESVHRSKFESFFLGVNKAAFFKTGSGVVEVIFFPDTNGVEKLHVTERRDNGRYVYSFYGQPHPSPPADTIDSVRPVYFVMHGSWFVVTNEQELANALRSKLTLPKQKEAVVTKRASGTFEVKLNPREDKVGDATIGRLSIDKQFHGDLEGASKGQMLAAGTDVTGSAGYVAMERVTGTLHGHNGTFALQHSGTMTRGAAQLIVTVVPDSGTGELVGLAGKMMINIVDGKHLYDFDYTLAKPD